MRLSGNKTCVDRICDFQGLIGTVVVGVKEPGDFVANNEGEEKLRDAGVDYLYVPGLEEEILEIAKRGHGRRPSAVQ